MKLTKVLTFLLVMCFLASTAVASNVKVAPNGKGDVLIYPLFFNYDGGIETKLTVANTSTTQSTVAKLVVRSHKYSKELLDFFIYLSPADVWEGTLKYDAATEKYVMYSEDGSAQALDKVWASADEPMNVELKRTELSGGEYPASDYGDTEIFGYVYVINAATSNGDPEDEDYDVEIGDDTENINEKVAKPFIKKWFDGLVDDDLDNDTANPQNILAGWMDFNVNGYTSKLNATTLADYQLIALPILGKDTVFGIGSENKLAHVEAALAKNNIVMPYQATNTDATIHFFNYPTKYSTIGLDDERVAVSSGGSVIRGLENEGIKYPSSPFFDTDNGNGIRTSSEVFTIRELCVEYTPSVYDMEEEKMDDPEQIFSPYRSEKGNMCDEVYFWGSAASEFDAGVTHYDFDNARTEVDGDFEAEEAGSGEFTYYGAPVIPFTMEIGGNGLSLAYGAWTDGRVTTDTNNAEQFVPYYQYHGFLPPAP